MKTFRQLMNEMMTSTSGAVAGMHQSVEPLDGLPQVAEREADRVAVKKKKDTRESFAGCPVFTVSSDEYTKCMHGRMRYERWNKKLNMEEMDNQEIRTYAHKNPGRALIIKDETYGTMSYFIPRQTTNEDKDEDKDKDKDKVINKYIPHGIKSDPQYKKAKTRKQILAARDQWNLRNPMDLWVGESVTTEAVGDVFAPSGNEPAGEEWKITDYHKSPNIMKRKLMKTKRGRSLWKKYADRPQTPGGDTKSTVMSGKLKGNDK